MTIFLSDLMPKTGEIIDKAQTMPIIGCFGNIYDTRLSAVYVFSDSGPGGWTEYIEPEELGGFTTIIAGGNKQ